MQLEVVEEGDTLVMYAVYEGRRIAKRYSRQNWISLEPGYTVRGGMKGDPDVTVEYDPDYTRVQ